jgi:hypothetical protein
VRLATRRPTRGRLRVAVRDRPGRQRGDPAVQREQTDSGEGAWRAPPADQPGQHPLLRACNTQQPWPSPRRARHNRRSPGGVRPVSPARENSGRGLQRRLKTPTGRERAQEPRFEKEASPRLADQPGMGAFRALQRGGRSGWIEQKLDKTPLILHRETDEMVFLDCSLSSLSCSRDDEVTDAAALDLGGAFHDGKSVRGNPCLKARGAMFLGQSGPPLGRFLLYGSLTYRSRGPPLPIE